jgi:uncharacterized protein with HEPN domain
MHEVDHTIRDILETIERVEVKVAGKSFDEFQADWGFRFAVRVRSKSFRKRRGGCRTT